MNMSVTGTHQLALYFLDFSDSGYNDIVTLTDTSSHAVLDTQTVGSFHNGTYLVWNVSGNITVTFTATGGHWAALSGIFFGGTGPTAPLTPTGLTASRATGGIHLTWTASTGATSYNVYRGPGPGGESSTPIATGIATTSYTDTAVLSGPAYYKVVAVNSVGGSFASNEATSGAATATFVTTDTTTEGTWKGTYGVDGYDIFEDTTTPNPVVPSYATFSFGAHKVGLWTNNTTAVNCLQKAAPGSTTRIAGVWFQTSWSMTVNMTGTHKLALYLLDFNNSGYAETVTIKDAGTGAFLNSQAASSFSGGKYLVWNINGNVTVTITGTGSSWGVLSGIFFG